MSLIDYSSQPELRNPIMIVAFAGWNDAAESATTAVKFLIDKWKPAKFAEINSEDFFVFTETRPTVKFVDSMQRTVVWPTNQFYAYSSPEMTHDVILFQGVEPQLKWKTFGQLFLEICRKYQVSEAIFLGALLAEVPHSISVPMSGTSTTTDMLERLHEMAIRNSRYEGPTGIIGVLQDICRQSSIPAVSLWAAAPHYLAATPNIKVTASLLTYMNTFLSLGLDLSDIQSDALRFEEQISTLVARDAEASAYVRRLEEQIDDSSDDDEDENPDVIVGTGPLPSADSLIRGVEELLRKERENGSQLTDDEDGEGGDDGDDGDNGDDEEEQEDE